jgi:integrase/recombinase XerC
VGLDDGRAHPHTFRHSYAVHLLKNNVPITVVQKLLGHSSIENTAIYLAVVQSDIREFVERVEW